VGSLKVTCSRLGISLRRPRVKLLPPKRANGTETTVGGARFTIDMKYKGQEHSTELPFTPDLICQLALEASFRDQEIGELAKDILVSVLEKELVPKLLDELCGDDLSADAKLNRVVTLRRSGRPRRRR